MASYLTSPTWGPGEERWGSEKGLKGLGRVSGYGGMGESHLFQAWALGPADLTMAVGGRIGGKIRTSIWDMMSVRCPWGIKGLRSGGSWIFESEV